MSNKNYLIIHKDHPMDPLGVNAGAEMATLAQARFLARKGARVIIAAQLVGEELVHQGVEFWDLTSSYDVNAALERAKALGSYHLISEGRALPLLQARHERECISRTLISHDRSSNDTGIKASVLSAVVDNIICVSEAQRRFFIDDGADPGKVFVIHNGADLDIFKVGEPEGRNYKRLVFAGALVPDKGIQLLIEAFAHLKQKYPELLLDVYGSAAMWGRDKMFDESEIERGLPGIKFHGGVNQELVAQAFREAGLVVAPSIWFDPFPLTAIEAQVTGCPVLTFNVGGLPEGVEDGQTGAVVQDISVEALTHKLDELLASPDLLKQWSKNALEKQRSKFTWERFVDRLIECCESAEGMQNPLKAKPSTVKVKKQLGFLSTWNQQCGLATYARYLLNAFEPGSYIVLAEKSDGPLRKEDESFVSRCWSRTEDDWDDLYEAIKSNDIGLLHLNAQAGFFKQPSFTQFITKIRSEGVKVVLHLHSIFTLESQVQALVSSVDATIVHAPESRLEAIANGAKADSVYALPHGVDVQESPPEAELLEFRQASGVPAEGKLLVCLGFVQPHKGIEGLIDAVADLNKNNFDTYGLVAGKINPSDPGAEKYLQQLKQYVAERGVSGKVIFMDRFLSESEMNCCLNAADVVLMNYRSQHYEASGACSLALGAGAVVATSTAPAFAAFGDAVWHITAGFSPSLSLALLLGNEELRKKIKANVDSYCEVNAWPQIAKKLKKIYRKLDFVATISKKEKTVIKTNPAVGGEKPLRVLIQNRPNTFTQRGGDTVVIEKTVEGLKQRGIDVTVDLEGTQDPGAYDLLHLFNFALPLMLKPLAEKAKQSGTPYVVTTLCEDVPTFHTQSHAVSQTLIEYVRAGQDRKWLEANWPKLNEIPACNAFDNHWLAKNARALISNGEGESAIIRTTYLEAAPVYEVKLGCEIGVPEADPTIFEREFGVSDFILCVGRIESRKNQLMLLKALEDLDLPLVLAGGGFSYQPDYEAAVRSFKRRGKTLILDRISPELLASAYAAAKVHALPSWFELPGLVSLEAAYYGCNIVATGVGTTKDYLGEDAFYCNAEDANSILNAVLAAYYAPQRTSLSEKVKTYNWDKTAQATLDVYHECCESRQESQQREALPIQSAHSPEAETPGSSDSGENTVFQARLEQGEEAAKEKNYELAHQYLAEAEEIEANSVRCLRARAAVYIAEQNAGVAKEYLDRAFKLDQHDPKILSGLGMCAMMNKEPEKAYDYFVNALSIDADQLVAILQLVESSYILDRYDDLGRVLNAYVERHPEDENMRFCYAGCLYKQGAISQAISVNNQVLELSPNHLGANELKVKLEECQRAEQSNSQNTSPEPQDSPSSDSPGALNPSSIGASANLTRMVDDAIDKLKRSREGQSTSDSSTTSQIAEQRCVDNHDLSTQSMQSFERLTALEEAKKKREFDKVITEIDELLEGDELNDGQYQQAVLIKAESLAFSGKLTEAWQIFESVSEQNPNNCRAICGKGALLASKGDWEKAYELFQVANNLDPKFDTALAGLGMCAAVSGEQEEAWRLYKEALKLNAENTTALLGLIELSHASQQFDDLQQALEAYIDLHPADLNFLYSLAGCYYAQDKLQEAISELDKITLFDPTHKNALELKEIIDKRLATNDVAHATL